MKVKEMEAFPQEGLASSAPCGGAVCQASDGAGAVEAPIATYPNFEHLEAEGQRLLPEQLKVMLRALAKSDLLRGENG